MEIVNVPTGVVKWFDMTRGFDFISQRDGTDTFLHIRDAKAAGMDKVREGYVLTFDLAPDKRGRMSATNLRDGRGRVGIGVMA